MPKKIGKHFWLYRPLLTETLPYELPVIFGNDRFYYSRCRLIDPAVKPLLDALLPVTPGYTIPYSYDIRKDSDRTTQLSIVHPTVQLEFCDFYAKHESSLLEYCNRSEFSLRHPAAVAAIYVANMADLNESVLKTGEVHLPRGEAEPELSKLVSYFVYKKHNLLNKFYESQEFIRLEKKFEMLRQIDISKCFYSIYTHSISWAAKGKKFAKTNKDTYSFESAFDSLMQRANYNETNGIVVGPEFSRIFAEIILQSIDKNVMSTLAAEGLSEGEHYSIRRYVDDYSVFANGVDTLNRIESILRRELQEYKLYVNEAKVAEFNRPFVSGLTQARSSIRHRMSAIHALMRSESWKSDAALTGGERHTVLGLVQDLRLIAKQYDVKFSGLSGSLIGSLRRLVRTANSTLDKQSTTSINQWMFMIKAVLECAFYLASVDLRVRTTYGVCQLLAIVRAGYKQLPASEAALIDHIIEEDLIAISERAFIQSEQSKTVDSIELFNLLICGAHLLRARFVQNSKVRNILNELLKNNITYFKYITIKYCLLKSSSEFKLSLDELNNKVEDLISDKEGIKLKSELFHLFCDHIGAPDIDEGRKLAVYKKAFGGSPSKAAVARLGEALCFTDWSGVWIEHSLRRRQMRPVYAVA